MSEDTIFREVDEELRRDRLQSGWRRYGPFVIGAAIAVVGIVAVNEGWSWWQNSNSARSSDQFYAALNLDDGGDIAGAQKALDTVIAQGSGGYPVLAKFKQAGLLAKQGKRDEALAAFDALGGSQSNGRLRELALLFAANVLVDKGDVAGVKQRVLGLTAADDPLRNSAREAIGLAQYKSGDLNGARDSFEAVINDPTSPTEIRSRLQLYVAQLVAQGATPPAAQVTEITGQTPDAAAAAAINAINAAVQSANAPAATTAPAVAPAAATAPAAASTPAPADATTPAGVESSQPSAPDNAALNLAVPAPAATAPAATTPALSTGLPTPADAATQPAPATSTTQPAPANGASQPAPASGTTGQ